MNKLAELLEKVEAAEKQERDYVGSKKRCGECGINFFEYLQLETAEARLALATEQLRAVKEGLEAIEMFVKLNKENYSAEQWGGVITIFGQITNLIAEIWPERKENGQD